MTPSKAAPLSRALDQSEQVHDKVEQAASDLSSVNAVLKDELAAGVPLATLELALDKSEAIEGEIQEAAEELLGVNDALAKEIDERRELELQLSISDAALIQSRADEREARHIALHDPVTELPNLTLFNDRLRNALAQAERHAWRLAVMFIDLDGFKAINDTHGHDIGDKVLVMVARRLRSIVRAGDTVSRRGGDEFLFLMLEAQDESNAAKLAAKIIATIAAPCDIEGVHLTIKSSIGIALYPEDGQLARDLLKHADLAMYAAKKQRKGAALFSELPQSG